MSFSHEPPEALKEFKKLLSEAKSTKTFSQEIDYQYALYLACVKALSSIEQSQFSSEYKEIQEKQKIAFEYLSFVFQTDNLSLIKKQVQEKQLRNVLDPEYVPSERPKLTSMPDSKLGLLENNFYLMDSKPDDKALHNEKYDKSYIFVKSPPGLFYINRTKDKKDVLQVNIVSLNFGDKEKYLQLLEKINVKKASDLPFQDKIEKDILQQLIQLITQNNKKHTLKGKQNFRKLANLGLAHAQGRVMFVNTASREEDKLNDKFKTFNASNRSQARVIIRQGKFARFNGEKFIPVDTRSHYSHGKAQYASYVINDSGELSLFTHDKFYDGIAHSSWNAGRPVIGAGEMKIINGKLITLTFHSGHYQPTMQNVYETLKRFENYGVDISDVTIITAIQINEIKKQETSILPTYRAKDIYDYCTKLSQKTTEEILQSFKDMHKSTSLDTMIFMLNKIPPDKLSGEMFSPILEKAIDSESINIMELLLYKMPNHIISPDLFSPLLIKASEKKEDIIFKIILNKLPEKIIPALFQEACKTKNIKFLELLLTNASPAIMELILSDHALINSILVRICDDSELLSLRKLLDQLPSEKSLAILNDTEDSKGVLHQILNNADQDMYNEFNTRQLWEYKNFDRQLQVKLNAQFDNNEYKKIGAICENFPKNVQEPYFNKLLIVYEEALANHDNSKLTVLHAQLPESVYKKLITTSPFKKFIDTKNLLKDFVKELQDKSSKNKKPLIDECYLLIDSINNQEDLLKMFKLVSSIALQRVHYGISNKTNLGAEFRTLINLSKYNGLKHLVGNDAKIQYRKLREFSDLNENKSTNPVGLFSARLKKNHIKLFENKIAEFQKKATKK